MHAPYQRAPLVDRRARSRSRRRRPPPYHARLPSPSPLPNACVPLIASRLAQDREMEDVFSKFGKLVNIWIARNPAGFAYVVSG
jgi:hypothetical protein